MGSVSVALLLLGHTRNDEGVFDAAAVGCAEPGDGAGQGRGLRLALRPGLLCQEIWVHVRWRAERSPRAGGPAEELRPHAPAAPGRTPPTPPTPPAHQEKAMVELALMKVMTKERRPKQLQF